MRNTSSLGMSFTADGLLSDRSIIFGSALINVLRYGLAAATSIMFWMVAKKPAQDPSRRVRMNKHW